MSVVRSSPRRLAGLLAATLTVVALSAVTHRPAYADHQTCTGDYPHGTLIIGHPDLNASKDIGWNGQVALNNIETAVFAASSIRSALEDGSSVAVAVAEIIHEKDVAALKALDGPPEKVVDAALSTAEIIARAVAIGLTTAALAAYIAETTVMAVQRNIEGKVAGEDACSSVVLGDMVDQLWVATVQRNLASDGPPLALLLIPTDSEEPGGNAGEWPLQPQHEEEDYAWCPEIDLPEALPDPAGVTDLNQPNGPGTGGSCVPGYMEGFLDEPYDGAPRVTVQAIVRDAIDHAKAHHLPVRQAEDHYAAAVAALGNDRYKEAFVQFRSAYQAAAGQDG
jgi:hypothetical protein